MNLTPLRLLMIVRKYTKPEKIGSIWVNPAWRKDNSRSLWEVVEAPDAVEEWFGFVPEPDTILVTARNCGVFAEELSETEEIYFLDARSVVRVVPWKGGKPMLTKDKALVKLDEPEEATAGGIIVPQTSRGRAETGTVVEAGKAFSVSVGERVLFTPFVGTEVEIEGDKLLVVREEEILAILGGEDE